MWNKWLILGEDLGIKCKKWNDDFVEIVKSSENGEISSEESKEEVKSMQNEGNLNDDENEGRSNFRRNFINDYFRYVNFFKLKIVYW